MISVESSRCPLGLHRCIPEWIVKDLAARSMPQTPLSLKVNPSDYIFDLLKPLDKTLQANCC